MIKIERASVVFIFLSRGKQNFFLNIYISGVFQSYHHVADDGTMDVYVDGGLLCNYPIHAFDGKWSITLENAAVNCWFDLGESRKKIVCVYWVLFI